MKNKKKKNIYLSIFYKLLQDVPELFFFLYFSGYGPHRSFLRHIKFSLILDVEKRSELFEKATAGVWEAMSLLPLAVRLQIRQQPVPRLILCSVVLL